MAVDEAEGNDSPTGGCSGVEEAACLGFEVWQ